MFRVGCLSILAVLLQGVSASGQQWAQKMFSESGYDFGPVARAATVEHQFVIKNVYNQDLHIAGVRSSCGCTAPRIVKDTLKPNEQSAIIAAFNTRAFTGQHGAQVTVTFDRPQYAEVQLQVRGYIRTDVVLNPGQVNLGKVDRGAPVEKKITIEHAGRNDWKILDVKPSSAFLTASVNEVARQGGRVAYELAVQLKPDAPEGYIKDQLLVSTNDQRAKQFPVIVEGSVVADLTVSPSTLMLGILQPGQEVAKQIVLKGKQPFRVLGVKCDNEAFTFEPSNEAKPLHLIPVKFVAGSQPGKIIQRIEIQTDLGDHRTVELTAYGEIALPLAGD